MIKRFRFKLLGLKPVHKIGVVFGTDHLMQKPIAVKLVSKNIPYN